MNICFIGAGAFGKALGDITEYNGHSTKYFDPYKLPGTTLESALKNSEIIVFVAPSETAEETLKLLPKDIPLICASKGFLSVEPFKHFKDFSVLSGAAFASELKSALSSTTGPRSITLTATSPLSETIFSTEFLKIEYTSDTLGVLLCGAMKNIYAIGAGIWSSNQENDDSTSVNFTPYLTTAAEEMQEILKANGADSETVKLSCGLPDLLLSCSPTSRNFQYGIDIARGGAESGVDISTRAVAERESDSPTSAVATRTDEETREDGLDECIGESELASATARSKSTRSATTLEGLSALSRLSSLTIPASCTLIRDIERKVHAFER